MMEPESKCPGISLKRRVERHLFILKPLRALLITGLALNLGKWHHGFSGALIFRSSPVLGVFSCNDTLTNKIRWFLCVHQWFMNR
jgi:hypothetical protein